MKRFAKIGGSLGFLRLILIITMFCAAAFLYYDWTATMTGATPNVVFYKWIDGTNATTIDLTYNIYKGIQVRDYNATYGIKNGYGTSKTLYMWAESCNASTWFANFTVVIMSETNVTKATWTTTDFASVGEGTAVSWSQDAGKIYTIRIYETGNDNVVVDNKARVELKLKTQEQPLTSFRFQVSYNEENRCFNNFFLDSNSNMQLAFSSIPQSPKKHIIGCWDLDRQLFRLSKRYSPSVCYKAII